MTETIRELVNYLHHQNGAKAEAAVGKISDQLKAILAGGADPGDFTMQQAQQTLFAIDEARLLLEQGDFEGSRAAARDALKEWRQKPASGVAHNE